MKISESGKPTGYSGSAQRSMRNLYYVVLTSEVHVMNPRCLNLRRAPNTVCANPF